MNTIIIAVILGLVFVLAIIAFLVMKRLGRDKQEKESARGDNLHLEEKLNRNQYKIIKKISLPVENGVVTIGPLLVSIYGIFLVDRICSSGDIQTGNEAQTWTAGKGRKKKDFPNPLLQNVQYMRILQEKLEVGFNKFRSVIVFDDKSNFLNGAPPNVITESHMIEYIQSYGHQILQEKEVRDIEKKLKVSPIFNTISVPLELETEKEDVKKAQGRASREPDFYPPPFVLAQKAEKKKASSPSLFKRPIVKIVFVVVLIIGLALLAAILREQYKEEMGDKTTKSSGGAEQAGKNTGGFLDFLNPKPRSDEMQQSAIDAVNAASVKTKRIRELDEYLFAPDGAKKTSPGTQGKQTSPGSVSGGGGVFSMGGDPKKREPQAIYSWKNSKGQRVYSTKGFPVNEKYSEARIEWQ